MILNEAHDLRDYAPYDYGWPDDVTTNYTFTVYELLCTNCRAHFFIFEGGCCPCCGVDEAVDIGEITCKISLDRKTGCFELA